MRAARYHEHGGPEVLRVETVPEPDVGPGEVRISVRAAAVNPVDAYFREGSYVPPSLPMTPGSDAAGVVEAVGDGVERLAAGDRVFATCLGNDRQGTCAESVVAPADRVAVLPDGIDFTEGAAAALVGATAWRALIHHAGLEPAENCLVHGGSGGVGHLAVQLAAATGARTVATARETYHDRLTSLGADAAIDYRRDDLGAAVREAGAPDVVVDHRLDEYLSFDAAVARRGCRVVGIGNTDAAARFDDVPSARASEITLSLTSVFNTPDVAAVLDRVGSLVAAGDVVPDVARTYDLDDVAAAHRALDGESFFGKLVVRP